MYWPGIVVVVPGIVVVVVPGIVVVVVVGPVVVVVDDVVVLLVVVVVVPQLPLSTGEQLHMPGTGQSAQQSEAAAQSPSISQLFPLQFDSIQLIGVVVVVDVVLVDVVVPGMVVVVVDVVLVVTVVDVVLVDVVVVVVVPPTTANLKEPLTEPVPTTQLPVPGGPPSNKPAYTADTVTPWHASGTAGIVHVPDIVLPPIVGVASYMPRISPLLYCISHPVSASIWKKSTAEQSPDIVPDMDIVSPSSQ